MGESVCIGLCGANSAISAISTIYAAPFGGVLPLRSTNTVRANGQLLFRNASPGLLRNGRISIQTNSGWSGAQSIQSVRNTSVIGVNFTSGTNVTGTISDLTHNGIFSNADPWNLQITTPSGSAGSLILAGFTAELVCPNQAFTQLGSNGTSDGGVAGNNATGFYTVAGDELNAAEAVVQIPMLESATLSNLQFRVTTNTSASAGTGRSRKNGANGAQSCSITSGTTGLYEDTTNSDSVVTGDLINASVTSGASSTSIKCSALGMKYVGSASGRAPCYSNDSGVPVAVATSQFGGLFGAPVEFTTEALVNTPAPFAGSAQLLGITVSANASTTDCPLVHRKAGVTGNQLANVTALTTGFFQDTTHSDSFVAADLLTNQISGATTGGLTVVAVGVLINGPVDTIMGASAQ